MVKQGAVCADVVDGDTFDTRTGIIIRLARVYAPEIDTEEGKRAKGRLEMLILDKPITYEVVARDDWGRVVAEVRVNNVNVNDVMRSYGYAEPW